VTCTYETLSYYVVDIYTVFFHNNKNRTNEQYLVNEQSLNYEFIQADVKIGVR